VNVETLVNDVKARADVVVTRGQQVLEAGVDTIKAANAIFVDGVQTLFQTQVAAGKELIDLAQASFEKARTDGLKAVASNPVAYLPEGKETVVAAYNDSVETVSKAGDKLAKTFKGGYSSITARLNGTKPAARTAKKSTRKTTAKARKAPAKATAAA
jgi:hypothetical protein